MACKIKIMNNMNDFFNKKKSVKWGFLWVKICQFTYHYMQKVVPKLCTETDTIFLFFINEFECYLRIHIHFH